MLNYNCEIDNTAIVTHLHKLINQVYKLLPSREEGLDWQKPLSALIEEFAGMNRLFSDHQTILFTLLCKLEGLFELDQEQDFDLYRKTIFECLNLLSELKTYVQFR